MVYVGTEDFEAVYWLLAYYLAIPLPLILIPDVLGNITGTTFGRPGPIVNKKSPSAVLELLGWFFLFFPLAIFFVEILILS
ncbi:hypothetical protein [Phorcysia thermohydrogeniphila]|uniref:hypothetical protein n=1 Tax=Phorcysia thermohydrogeniphila TaxID=936138 RepID=UPI001043A6C4|nr:hypothetical protein [Phorcysia thermohydrogeniphila]